MYVDPASDIISITRIIKVDTSHVMSRACIVLVL